MKLVEGWAIRLWNAWSIRFNAIGLAILSIAPFDPVSALGVWNMMPPAVHSFMPRGILTYIGMFFFVLAMIARLVSQPKMRAKVDAHIESKNNAGA